MKNKTGMLALPLLIMLVFSACSGGTADKEIVVVSREDGSGTRSSFVELMDVVKKGPGDERKDMMTKEAIIAKQTDVMMANISGNKYAVGFMSLGSLNDTVKPVIIDGVAASTETVTNGSYSIARSFSIVTTDEISEVTADFIDFIMSAEGQSIVSDNYIAIDAAAQPYSGSRPAGKTVVAGSSSVTPVMEKLKEAYIEMNGNALVEIQQSDSSAGIQGAIDRTCDIGMSSRDLKDSEKENLNVTEIALDAIIIVVSNENSVDSLTKEEVRDIFTGEIEKWSELS